MKRIFITCLNGFLLACPLQAQTQIADIFPGLSSSAPAAFKEYSGRLYFVADDGTSGRELWSTDLSGQNTLLHKDIRAGSLGSDPAGLRDGPQRLDSLIYQVTDPSGLMATATVLITVIAVNDPPIANDESISTDEDTAVSIELSATDVDSLDVLSFSLISQPTHTSVFISGITTTYTPEANYNSSDGFDYLVTDTGGLFNEATISLTVTAINDSPFASNSTLSTLKNTQGTIDVRNVVSDIEDPDDALVYTVSTNANNGSTVSSAQLASGIYLYRVIAVYGSGRQEASGRLAIRR